jgi:subtilisin family serine protease
MARFILIVLLSLAAVSANPAVTRTDGLEKVDPRVFEDTAGGKTGSFLVWLGSQADLSRLAGAQPGSQNVVTAVEQLQWVAQLRQAPVISAVERLSQGRVGTVHFRSLWLANAVAVSGPREVVTMLAALPDVVRIEADRAFLAASGRALLASQPEAGSVEPNLTQIGAPQVWARGDTGQGIVYANADTGVQWDHPALKSQYRGWNAGTNSVDHNYNWHDAIQQPINGATNPCGIAISAPCDDFGHGTHTMGIGVGDDGRGNQIGVAPGVKWIACRNMDEGTGRPSTYIDCLQFLMAPTDLTNSNPRPELHADVISNSYSCPTSELCTAQDVLHQAVEAVRAAGIFMAVSVGNGGCGVSSNPEAIEPPAVEPDVFTVGAVDPANRITIFSSRGPATYLGVQYLKPDLVAPGLGIRSSIPGSIYGVENGTSMAAPHVAGAVALLWSAFPDLRGKVPETEQLLRITAHPLTAQAGDLCGASSVTGTPNDVYGYGGLDVLAAYEKMAKHLSFPIIRH